MKIEIESTGSSNLRPISTTISNLKGHIFFVEVTLSSEFKKDPTCCVISDAISERKFVSIGFVDEKGKSEVNLSTEKKDELSLYSSKIFILKSDGILHRFLFIPEKTVHLKKEIAKNASGKEAPKVGVQSKAAA